MLLGRQKPKKDKKLNENTGFEHVGFKKDKKLNENTGFERMCMQNHCKYKHFEEEGIRLLSPTSPNDFQLSAKTKKQKNK